MATPSPYRTLPPARRAELITRALGAHRELRAVFVSRLVQRGGGFRAVTVQSWPAERLAREVVRLNAETPQDELDLLHFLFVELEPAAQISFLEAAGVAHTNGVMADGLEAPYADAEAVRRAAAVVRERHGDDGERYLRTLDRYSREGWPGIEDVVREGAASRG
jgi:hypothetical protein